MNSMELIDNAIKFQNSSYPVKKRIGEWIINMDLDTMTDIMEQMTEVQYENQGDDYVFKALMSMREFIDTVYAKKATEHGLQWLVDFLGSKLKNKQK